jgi:quercetin dioxygenase-like cupin family protein
MQLIDGAGNYRAPEGPQSTDWIEQLRVQDLSVGTYSIAVGATDDQEPHWEDEIYVVTAGRAVFEAGGERVPVGPGSVLYVAAREVHRFTDVTEDLATVVFFAPAEGARLAEFAADYVAVFNSAVASGDYAGLLERYADDAVLRFENVPPSGSSLEFAGRQAYTQAYEQQPPDDQIALTGEPREEDGHVVLDFAWSGDRSPGTLRLKVDAGLISAMTVTFAPDGRARQL